MSLWIDNDHHTYLKKTRELDRLDRTCTASDAVTIAASCGFPGGRTPDHSPAFPPSAIDWHDIAADWEIERIERMSS